MELDKLKSECDRLSSELKKVAGERDRIQTERDKLAQKLQEERDRIQKLQAELSAVKAQSSESDRTQEKPDVEPAKILNLIKRKSQKSRVSLADIELILEVIESLKEG